MRFFRTVAGKALLFLTVIFCVLAIVLSGFMMYVNWEQNIYKLPKERLLNEDARGRITASAYDDIHIWLDRERPADPLVEETYSNLHAVMRDEKGKAVLYSDAAARNMQGAE